MNKVPHHIVGNFNRAKTSENPTLNSFVWIEKIQELNAKYQYEVQQTQGLSPSFRV